MQIQYQLNPGQAPQTREVPWAEILQIDFTLDDEFHQLLATTNLQKDSIKLLARWQVDQRLLSRPSTRSATSGSPLLDRPSPTQRSCSSARPWISVPISSSTTGAICDAITPAGYASAC